MEIMGKYGRKQLFNAGSIDFYSVYSWGNHPTEWVFMANFHNKTMMKTASWPQCAADQRRLDKCRAENSDLQLAKIRDKHGVYL